LRIPLFSSAAGSPPADRVAPKRLVLLARRPGAAAAFQSTEHFFFCPVGETAAAIAQANAELAAEPQPQEPAAGTVSTTQSADNGAIYPNAAESGEARYPYELDKVAGASFVAAARAAYETHLEVGQAWKLLDEYRPEIVALFGRGHPTPHRAWVEDEHLRVSRARSPEWLPNPDWLGDGTVPAIAALPSEDADDRRGWQAVTQRHLPMAAAPAIVEALRNYAGESLHPIRGVNPAQPWLGLDLLERWNRSVHRFGSAHACGVRMHPPGLVSPPLSGLSIPPAYLRSSNSTATPAAAGTATFPRRHLLITTSPSRQTSARPDPIFGPATFSR
jgi:hypothetical protein